jgi:cytochrome c-type biogenesis protein CcmH
MRLSRRSLPWIVLGGLLVVALVVLVTRSQPSSAPEARANRLAHSLACPECDGESVADSNSVSSRAIRAKIAELIGQGQTDAQIRALLVSKYGEKVLRTPANSGIGLVAWIIPFAAILLGFAGILLALRRWSRTPRLSATPEDEAVVAAAREHASDHTP